MSTAPTSVFFRNDTMLGVCEALGEDFGFNPLWLRIAFALPLIWNPVAVIAAYVALGGVVLLSRLAFPNSRRTEDVVAAADPLPLMAENDEAPVLAAA